MRKTSGHPRWKALMRGGVPSRTIAAMLSIWAGFALWPSPASAQSHPDALVDERGCDPLFDATPGLRGLCVAYCEIRDCSNLDSPECSALRSNYDRRRQTGDPDLPCLPICPCFALSELRDLPVEVNVCEIGDADEFAWSGVWDRETASQGPGVFSTTFGVDFAQCRFRNAAVDPAVSRFARISQDEAAVCHAIVAAFVIERELTCN